MTPLTWQNYIINSLREYFLEPLLKDKDLTRYLSLLPPADLSKVILGMYYISEYPSSIIPITRDNSQILVDSFLEIIKDN